MKNLDERTVAGFGREWATFDQSQLDGAELQRLFDAYFAVFPWEAVGPSSVGFDVGCGSGRWDRLLAPRVGRLHCVDASEEALGVARRNLADLPNVTFHHASAGSLPFAPASMDFGISLGVLHHLPDTAAAIRSCAECLKPGAPFLLYLYYRFDGRPAWFRALWRLSEAGRSVISSLPHRLKVMVTDLIAVGVYWPLARIARLGERSGVDVDAFPLSAYRRLSFYTMRTDALDRFGTRLEQRFTRPEIRAMLEQAGIGDVRFSDAQPYWVASGRRL